MKSNTLILASSSPRRKELLEDLHLSFEVSSSEVDESYDPNDLPEQIVMDLSSKKASAVASDYTNAFVIGADTIVYHDGQVLGKPNNEEQAYAMLKALSGNRHSVFTGVTICKKDVVTTFFEETKVEFWELTDEDINNYINSGEPFDKAGAYGIQGVGRLLVRAIEGDYFSVVGLPISRTIRELKALGFSF